MSRFTELLSGLKANLAFSNAPLLIFQRLFFRNLPIVTYRWKDRFSIICDARRMDAQSVKELLADGVYNPFLRASARDGRLAYVNLGANIGCFDIAVAGLGLEITEAISVELNPLTYHRLVVNLEINGLERVKALNYGASGRSGEIKLTITDCSLSDSIYHNLPAEPGAEVRTVCLEPLARLLEIGGSTAGEFDLLKVDCEGAEFELVEHVPPETLRRFRHIVMEIHASAADTGAVDALYAKVGQCGFRPEGPKWTPQTGSGLCFWSRQPL